MVGKSRRSVGARETDAGINRIGVVTNGTVVRANGTVVGVRAADAPTRGGRRKKGK